MIDRTKFQVDSVPTIRVAPRLTVVIVARYSDIQIARCFRRGKHRKQCRDRAPVGEEVTLRIVGPGISAERVVALQSSRKRKLVALSSQLAQPSLLTDGRGTH